MMDVLLVSSPRTMSFAVIVRMMLSMSRLVRRIQEGSISNSRMTATIRARP
jgi:hypothetical protein